MCLWEPGPLSILNLCYLVMLMEPVSSGAVHKAAGPYWITAALLLVPVLSG